MDFLDRCRLDAPVAQAGMGPIAGARLAGAVAAAGGLGTVGLVAPDRLRARVRELRAELARPEEPDATPEEVASRRDRRVHLTSRLARTERELEEALRVLEVQA